MASTRSLTSHMAAQTPSDQMTGTFMTVKFSSDVKREQIEGCTDLKDVILNMSPSKSFDECQRLAEDFIIERAAISGMLDRKWEYDIATVWNRLEELGIGHEAALLKFQDRLNKSVVKRCGRSLDDFIHLGNETQRSLECSSRKILSRWHRDVMSILPADKYPEKGLSVEAIRDIEKLSSVVTSEEATKLLTDEMAHRAVAAPNSGRYNYQDVLSRKDVAKALKKAMPSLQSTKSIKTTKGRGAKPSKKDAGKGKKRKRSPSVSPSTGSNDEGQEKGNGKAPQEHPEKKRQTTPASSHRGSGTGIGESASVLAQSDSGLPEPPINETASMTLQEHSRSVGLDSTNNAQLPGDASTSISITSNDVAGAVRSLGPGQWLSTTAIQLGLEYCYTGGVKIFDPAFLTSGPPKSLSHESREEIWILPILLLGNHWALIVANWKQHTAECWNSLPTFEYKAEAERLLQNLNVSSTGTTGTWRLTAEPCFEQTNGDDCGVFTIIFAIYKMSDIPIPNSIDCHLWRELLRYLIDETYVSQEIGSTSRLPSSRKIIEGGNVFQIQESLRQDQKLVKQSWCDRQRNLLWAADMLKVSVEFLQRQKAMEEKWRKDLNKIEEKAIDMMSSTTDDISQTQDHLHETQSSQTEIKSKVTKFQKMAQGWQRATDFCRKEWQRRDTAAREAETRVREMRLEIVNFGKLCNEMEEDLRDCQVK